MTLNLRLSKRLKRKELKLRGGVPLNLLMSKSLERLDLKEKGGVSLNSLLSKSLKRLELKEKGGVTLFKLTNEQKSQKARTDAERRVGESSQAATIRLFDKLHSYATRSMTVADHVISTMIVLGR